MKFFYIILAIFLLTANNSFLKAMQSDHGDKQTSKRFSQDSEHSFDSLLEPVPDDLNYPEESSSDEEDKESLSDEVRKESEADEVSDEQEPEKKLRIRVDEPAGDAYQKLLQLPEEDIWICYKGLANPEEVETYEKSIIDGKLSFEVFKRIVAFKVITQYWSQEEAKKAEKEFLSQEKKQQLFAKQLCVYQRLLINPKEQCVMEGNSTNFAGLKELAVKILKVAGTNLQHNPRRWYIEYPLHLAATHGLLEPAATLLAEGANPNGSDHLRRKPLHCLAGSRRKQQLTRLEKLLCATQEALLATDLIDIGADVDGLDAGGNTSLSVACQAGKNVLATLLLAYGANPNLQVAESELIAKREKRITYACGHSPLFGACQSGHKPIVELLLKRDARMKSSEIKVAKLMYAEAQGEKKLALGLALGI